MHANPSARRGHSSPSDVGPRQLDLARCGLQGFLIGWILDSRRAGCLFRLEGLHRPGGDQEGCEWQGCVSRRETHSGAQLV